MKKNINLETIKQTVDLLKKVNVKNYVPIFELAKELKIAKTDIMLFVQENERLFNLSERWEPKTKQVTSYFQGRKYKDIIQVRGKHLGVCIENAYLHISDNYENIEWVEKMKTEMSKYLFITESDNYGSIHGYFIEIDMDKGIEKDKFRKHLWRNTKEKINSISEYLHKDVFYYGGYGDCYGKEYDYCISVDNIENLRKLGWTFNEFKPLSR